MPMSVESPCCKVGFLIFSYLFLRFCVCMINSSLGVFRCAFALLLHCFYVAFNMLIYFPYLFLGARYDYPGCPKCSPEVLLRLYYVSLVFLSNWVIVKLIQLLFVFPTVAAGFLIACPNINIL